MGQERREVHVTGGPMKGRKEVRVDVSKGKSITGMMTGRTRHGTGNNREGGREKGQQPGRCNTEELL